jgi:sterol desaturase/sphingolipid hydroxylase (fatty acid hydroxylase superfamily)
MSDAFFEKLFGDSEPGHLGTGWMSGTSSVFFGLLGFGGALCLHFPALLTLPDARAHYPMTIIRLLIQGSIVLAIVLGAISGLLRQRKVLAVTGVSLGLLAAIIGGGSTPLPDEVHTKFGLGLDWFLLDLFVMTVVFLPVERFWPLHPDQKTFRPQWTTDLFYFVATHLPAQLITLGMVIPASYASRWLAIPWLAQTVGNLPFLIQLPLAIVVADLSQYATHRAFHAIPFLWRFHAIHHSIETMDWVAGSRSHYVDILLTRGLILIPMTIFGFSQTTLAGYLVFVSFHATFCHTDFRPRTIWLEPHFVTVRYHHWHHAADKEAVDVNFAIHLPFIDRLFGTYYLPKDAWPKRYGLVGTSVPQGFFAQLLAPFTRDTA